MRKLLQLTVMLVFLVSLCPIAHAGYEIVQETTVKTPQGSSTVENRVYIQGKKMKVLDEAGNYTIFDYENMKMITVEPADKIYYEEDLKQMMEQASAMSQSMEIKYQVRQTDEKKTINDFKCKKYIIQAKRAGSPIGVTITIWATEDIKIEDGPAYYEILNLGDKEMAEPFEKIKGFPIVSETISDLGMFKVENRGEVKKVEKKKLDSSVFKVPKDFKMTERKNFMMDAMMQQGKNKDLPPFLEEMMKGKEKDK